MEGTMRVSQILVKMIGCAERNLHDISHFMRIVFLAGHHHTFKGISGLDYQILVEADYLVNEEESSYPPSNLDAAGKTLFKTATGCALLRSIYGVT
ncbi:hypothetical protein [Dysosmobacter sp.]